jgi:hypothetical protein
MLGLQLDSSIDLIPFNASKSQTHRLRLSGSTYNTLLVWKQLTQNALSRPHLFLKRPPTAQYIIDSYQSAHKDFPGLKEGLDGIQIVLLTGSK